MRKLFYGIALISLVLFLYNLIHITQQSLSNPLPQISDLKGFEDNNASDAYSQLVATFRQEISSHYKQAATDQTWYFWLSFMITALTAGSTFLSSIQAARKEPADPNRMQRFAILVALLTFCSTLTSFGSSHFNDRKTEETKKAVDLTTMRNQFYADYDKAPAEAKPAVIRNYAQRLD